MFDLEKSIAEWRAQMLTAGIKTPAPLDELEIHLREEIERRIKSGKDTQNAFESAVRSIGQPAAIQHEFAKARAPKWTRLKNFEGAFLGFLGVPHPAPAALADSAREVLEMGGKEALGFNHDFIGTEHVLLALLDVKTGAVSSVLRSLGVEQKTVRGEIEKIVGSGPQPVGLPPAIRPA